MGKTIDDKTVDKETFDDIVGLIRNELGLKEAPQEMQPVGGRLASLILGRLGYEVDKPSPLPDITPGDWKYACNQLSRNYEVYVEGGPEKRRETIIAHCSSIADTKLIAAAPKLRKAGYEYVTGVKESWEHMKAALRDAGVEL